MPYRRLPALHTAEEQRELAHWMLEGRVYHLDEVPQNLVPMVFMLFIFDTGSIFKGYTEKQLAKLAVFAVYGVDKDCGRAINGYPTFVECRVWRRAEVIQVQKMAKRAHLAMEQAMGESNAQSSRPDDERPESPAPRTHEGKRRTADAGTADPRKG